MLSRKAFFSFVELTDPAKHEEYNAYHQLDHRPANLALRSVVWGDRWVRSPQCADTSRAAEDPLDRNQYVAMYWFADPVDESIKEWRELGERAFQWGRKPDTDWSRRELGYFVPLKGYVNERVRVSADVLPFRPVRGVHITVSLIREPHSSATEEMYSWYDRVHIPDLLRCDGVAGAWTFYSEWTTLLDSEQRRTPGGARITLLYLDGDPLRFVAERDGRMAEWREAGRLPDNSSLETPILDSPLLDIRPWQWDWFDAGRTARAAD
jgi:hypothetical protein